MGTIFSTFEILIALTMMVVSSLFAIFMGYALVHCVIEKDEEK